MTPADVAAGLSQCGEIVVRRKDRGTEIERSFSYGAVRQLFERLVAQSDDAGRSSLLAGAAAHAGRLFSAEQLPGQRRAADESP